MSHSSWGFPGSPFFRVADRQTSGRQAFLYYLNHRLASWPSNGSLSEPIFGINECLIFRIELRLPIPAAYLSCLSRIHLDFNRTKYLFVDIGRPVGCDSVFARGRLRRRLSLEPIRRGDRDDGRGSLRDSWIERYDGIDEHPSARDFVAVGDLGGMGMVPNVASSRWDCGVVESGVTRRLHAVARWAGRIGSAGRELSDLDFAGRHHSCRVAVHCSDPVVLCRIARLSRSLAIADAPQCDRDHGSERRDSRLLPETGSDCGSVDVHTTFDIVWRFC